MEVASMKDDVLKANLARHVDVLANEIGPRGSTTAGEKRAAEYIGGFFSSLGFKVQTEEFSSLRTFSWIHAGAYLSSSLAVLVLLRFAPALAALVAGLSFIGFFLETLSVPALGWMASKGRSQNVIARAGEPGGVKVCVVAHYDSSRAGLPFHPKMVKNFRTTSFLVLICMVLSAALCISAALVPTFQDAAVVIGIVPGVYTAFAASLLIHRELAYPYVPGANDNASGVAVLLESARAFASGKIPGVEVTFLATGCEEAGVVGMLDFLKKHGKEYRDAYFINLDNLGAGDLKYTTGEGMYALMKSDPVLVELAGKAVDQDPSIKASPSVYRTLLTDGQAAMLRGHKVMGIMAFRPDGTLPNWHWLTDVPDNVQVENLAGATKLVVSIIEALPSRVAEAL
ncbi:MAG TPA: Zn-dependent exopeptidase M28 [Firmicutes bacterium]|nr:Zn-dependent exopeptidase M28 [Candidatus Fermentithermobacillaceae bacterium]